MDELAQQIKDALKQWEALHKCAQESLQQQQLLVKALDGFHTTLEQLQMAQENLRQKTEQLTAAAQVVKAERQRYQEWFEFALDGYLVTNLEGKIQEANCAAASLLNLSPQLLIDKALSSFVMEQERQDFERELTQLQQVASLASPSACAERQKLVMHLQPRDTQPVYAALSVSPVRDQTNKVVALRWLLRDITVVKRLEEERRTQGQQLRDLQAQLEQQTPDQVGQQQATTTSADEMFARNQIENRLNTEVRRLTFLLGLTERLQTSTSLKEMAQFALEYLVEAMNSAFGDVKVIINQSSSTLGECQVGSSAQTVVHQVSAQFIATCGQPAVAEFETLLNQGIPYGQGLLWQVVETGIPVFIENYAEHPQAVPAFRHPAIGQLGIFPIPSASGRIIGVLILESRTLQKLQEAPQQDMLLAACQTLGAAIERTQAQDQLRQINKDLERADQLKSEFLASMSHELRTPLTSILGFSSALSKQYYGPLNSKQNDYVSRIYESGQHLLALINDLLDLSKIEAGKMELELTWVSVQSLCNQCLRIIQLGADNKRLALSLELDGYLDNVLLDERRVYQMVINLLSNGVKFTPEGGQVKLSSRLASGRDLEQETRPDNSPVNPQTPYLCLEVTDTGIGIPKHKQSLLFQPFRQIDASLNRQHEGTGLGLVLTKRLAELHGGTLSFDSEAGIGSRFCIWLPVIEIPEQGQ